MTTLSAATDDELALDSSRGSRTAFETLYERHYRGVYDLVCRMVRERDAAADVVQTTFTNAWISLQKRRVSGNVRAWLYAIARNAAISELRRGRRRVHLGEGEAAERLPYAELDRDRLPDPERVVLDKEVAQLVWDSAAALNPREYSLLDLHVRKGFTPEEMAGSLGLSRGNVHTMLSRLRRSLEESVTGVLLARRGRNDCPELDALLAGSEVSTLTMETRRLISHHLEACSRCQESRRRFVSPAEIFAGLALIPMPEESRTAIWKAITAGLAAGGAGVGVVTQGAQEGVRWLLHGARSAYGMGTAGAAVVAGVIVGAIVFTSGGGGGGAEDPSDVRSTSHEIGEASAERVVVVEWTPQENADGYSVSWSRRHEDLPDSLRDLPGGASRTQSAALPDGSWYFHLRTEGGGEWTSTVHVGPFVIRSEAPATPTATPVVEGPSPSPVVAGATEAPATAAATPTATPQAPAQAPGPASPTAAVQPPPPANPSPGPTAGPLPAQIDVKPGNAGNNVNPDGHEMIAVALVSTDLLPASRVNVVSARFAGAAPARWAARDVNGDGIRDLVMHFHMHETSLGPQDSEACLEGSTFDGLRFAGCDTFTPVGRRAVQAGAGGWPGLVLLMGAALAAAGLAALRRLAGSS